MFEKFPSIEKFGKIFMTITQKLHGTNAQIYIEKNGDDFSIQAGSRTRFLTVEDDNYGFCKFVSENAKELIDFFGEGRHFGEWVGPGINSGEGLEEKMFCSFEHWKFNAETVFPKQVGVVPILYKGKLDIGVVPNILEYLRTNGSVFSPGFMRPEGIVIEICGQRFKHVFDPEETSWTKNKKDKPKIDFVNFDHLLQPIRLQKLLSRDERYVREYPKSLPDICKDYIQDLIKEEQIIGNEEEIKLIRKEASRSIFQFIRENIFMGENNEQ